MTFQNYMTFQDYFDKSPENTEDTKSYEEQLLLNYEGTFANELAPHVLYNIDFGNLEH